MALHGARFDGPELWGADGDPTVKISVDAWEPYLEPA
jgi:nitrile hydratase subunit beta